MVFSFPAPVKRGEERRHQVRSRRVSDELGFGRRGGRTSASTQEPQRDSLKGESANIRVSETSRGKSANIRVSDTSRRSLPTQSDNYHTEKDVREMPSNYTLSQDIAVTYEDTPLAKRVRVKERHDASIEEAKRRQELWPQALREQGTSPDDESAAEIDDHPIGFEDLTQEDIEGIERSLDAGESDKFWEVEEHLDVEKEEAPPRNSLRDPGEPTKEELEANMIDHIPYRSWCPFCAGHWNLILESEILAPRLPESNFDPQFILADVSGPPARPGRILHFGGTFVPNLEAPDRASWICIRNALARLPESAQRLPNQQCHRITQIDFPPELPESLLRPNCPN